MWIHNPAIPKKLNVDSEPKNYNIQEKTNKKTYCYEPPLLSYSVLQCVIKYLVKHIESEI